MADPVSEAAAALYRLPPDGFVAARDVRAKALRDTGDAAAGKQVSALRKPTVSAWLVNLLVADDPALPDQLAELARQLRTASDELSGDDLRALGRRRQELVAGLVHRARQLAHAAGRRATDSVVTAEVEATLRAALSDPDLAREVLSGQLLHPAQATGFGPPDLTSTPSTHGTRSAPAAAGPSTSRTRRGHPTGGSGAEPAEGAAARRRREHRDRAEARVREATRVLDEARRGHGAAEQAAAAAQRGLDATETIAASLRAQLDAAETARAGAAEESRLATRAMREATASVRVAEAALRRAQNRLPD